MDCSIAKRVRLEVDLSQPEENISAVCDWKASLYDTISMMLL